ncbi:MAG: S26 family signal peptidase [Pseudomonadota bacterium]
MIRNTIYVAIAGITVTSLGIAAFASLPIKWLYNPSPSAPIGFYAIETQRDFAVGDFVAARLPIDAEKLAVQRGYLPKKTPVLKTIAATAGDEICVRNMGVLINELPVAEIQTADSLGRPMPVKTGCYRLHSSEYFLLSTAIKNSFDSRYFGPVGEDDILGVATPLLIFEDEN